MEYHTQANNLTTLSAASHRQLDKDQFPPLASNHRLVIITQLLQIAGNMRHIDELWLWLSHMLVQRLDIQVIQFWASQPHHTNTSLPELRAMVCQNISLPQYVVINPQVTSVTQRIHNEQQGAMPQAVASFFLPPQAHLLTRYNLNYWASYFMQSKRSSPFAGPNYLDIAATPFTLSVSLFLQQAPSPHLLPTIEHILEQSLFIARNRGLLCHGENALCPINRQTCKAPALKSLIVQRVEDTNPIQYCHLFSYPMIILNKQMRLLYRTINGAQNIADLLASTQLETKDFYTALRALLAKKLIQLREPNGQRIEIDKLSRYLEWRRE